MGGDAVVRGEGCRRPAEARRHLSAGILGTFFGVAEGRGLRRLKVAARPADIDRVAQVLKAASVRARKARESVKASESRASSAKNAETGGERCRDRGGYGRHRRRDLASLAW